MNKILIAVYSQSGQSMRITNIIKEKLQADLYEIKPKRKYNDDMWKAWDEAQEEMATNAYPGLIGELPDLQEYDTVIVGGPVWGMTLANPVVTFMRNVDLMGKQVSAFWTFYDHDEKYDNAMKDYSMGADYVRGLSLPRSITGNAKKIEDKINQWIKTLN